MLASDSEKPDRSRRVDEMTKESRRNAEVKNCKDTETKDIIFFVTNKRELLSFWFFENKR